MSWNRRHSSTSATETVISRKEAHRRFIDEVLGLFGGRANLLMAHLVESGDLTLDDVKEAEKTLRKAARKERS